MSQDDDYSLPNCVNPLKGVTDTKMVQYWLKHGILDKELDYSKQDTHGCLSLFPLDQQAETVDILFATYNESYYSGQYTPQVCNTLTFDDMMQLYQRHNSNPPFKFTSFHYTLPNGDIYYSIVEILKNIKEDEIDTYIEKYSEECPSIFIFLSTLPYERSKQLLDSIQSIKSKYLSMRTYDDYLICSTALHTFNPDIYCIFKKHNSGDDFFGPAASYSPSAMQYMIDGDARFPVDDWDSAICVFQEENCVISKQCLDMIFASNKCSKIVRLLFGYIHLDDINKVKLLLGYNTPSAAVSIIENENLLHYAKSAEMIHFLVSCKVPLNSSLPLFKAIRHGSLDLVKALLHHKASLEGNQFSFDPLFFLGSASPDVVQFLIPFFSSSTSDISMHVKSNNTTGLPHDAYDHIKTSLSKVDINSQNKYGQVALHYAFDNGINVPYLLENNSSPHLYIQRQTSKWEVFDTFDDVLRSMATGSFDDVLRSMGNTTGSDPYCHYIDHTLLESDHSRLLTYHNIYNLIKYKAYPLTYASDIITANANHVHYSHLTRSIVDRHRDFITLLLRYLSPVNMPFQSCCEDPIPAMYPLETALDGDSPNKDIVYELIQYGAIHPTPITSRDDNNSTHLKDKYNHLHCNIKDILIDCNLGE